VFVSPHSFMFTEQLSHLPYGILAGGGQLTWIQSGFRNSKSGDTVS